jgi:hypothetical protein
VANDSDGSISRKVSPSGIFQATNAVSTGSQMKWIPDPTLRNSVSQDR